jgi:hypothetical protein
MQETAMTTSSNDPLKPRLNVVEPTKIVEGEAPTTHDSWKPVSPENEAKLRGIADDIRAEFGFDPVDHHDTTTGPRLVRAILHADGRVTNLSAPITVAEICKVVGARICGAVMLHDRTHAMYYHDRGIAAGLPRNGAATALYWDKCGGPVDAAIYGDVVVVPDSDYEEDEP